MAWELSANVDIDKLETHLSSAEYAEILEIWAEIKAWEKAFNDLDEENRYLASEPFDNETFIQVVEDHQDDAHLKEGMIHDIMTYALEVGRTTDNGGFNLWLCPYGCHTSNEF